MGCDEYSSEVLGIGFACTIGAGLASVLGALVVLAPSLQNKTFLAAAVSFAAGVMVYISFVDIYVGKSVNNFKQGGVSPPLAFLYATLCFFGGMPMAVLLDKLGAWLLSRRGAPDLPVTCCSHGHAHAEPRAHDVAVKGTEDSTSVSGQACDQDPSELVAARMEPHVAEAAIVTISEANGVGQRDDPLVVLSDDDRAQQEAEARRKLKLVKAGMLAALAVGFHNAPEGLVTFVSYLSSSTTGFATAIAIAIHNVPEGMVVAVPIYYYTGSRLKAIMWSSVAAVTEPLGALIGLSVACGGSLTPTVFGILFGLIAGIMVYVAIKELTPTARQYDPEDTVCTTASIAGMVVMAGSLVALQYA